MSSVLVVFASTYGTTRTIAERIASSARASGHEVDTVDLTGAPDAPLAKADLTVVASAVYSNQHHDDVLRWLRTHADGLASRRTVLVSVSLAAALEDDEGMCLDYVAELAEVTGFEPGAIATFPGALDESRYDAATKALLRVAQWRRGLGAQGDVSYTRLEDVDTATDAWLSSL